MINHGSNQIHLALGTITRSHNQEARLHGNGLTGMPTTLGTDRAGIPGKDAISGSEPPKTHHFDDNSHHRLHPFFTAVLLRSVRGFNLGPPNGVAS